MDPTPSPRRPGVAVLLALLCHGLGHLYLGRARAAIAIHAVSIGTGLALWMSMARGPRPALASFAVVLAF